MGPEEETIATSAEPTPRPSAEPSEIDPLPADPERFRHWSWRPWVHAIALAVVLLAGVALIDNGQIAFVDEGVYLAQAQNLSNGSWASERPAVDVDPDGEYTAVESNGVSGDKVVPYAKHPLYPLLLTPFFALGGVAGALVLSVLGTVGAALAAGLIARRIDVRLGPWAVWLVGLGSPLLFDAYLSVAHSLGAAAAGFAFLGISTAIDDRRLAPLTYALPAAAIAVGLRSEGLIAATAISAVIGVMALGWPPLRKVEWRSAWIALSVLATAGAAHLVERAVSDRLFAGTVSSFNPGAVADGPDFNPLKGVWPTLFRPGFGLGEAPSWSAPLVALTLLVAAVALKVSPTRRLVPLTMLGVAAGAAVVTAVSQPLLITGLFAASPVLAAGLVLLRRRDFADPLIVRAFAVCALGMVLVLATNYGSGGAMEWGGRFLHLFLPVVVPVALVGLRNGAEVLPRPELRYAGACVGIAVLGLSTVAIREHRLLREQTADYVQTTLSAAERATAGHPGEPALIVLSSWVRGGSSRYFWSDQNDFEVLRATSTFFVNELFERAVAHGHDRIVVVTRRTTIDEARADFEIGLEEVGLQIVDIEQSPGGRATVLTLGPVGAE